MPEYTWDQVDVDETITEADQKASNDINLSTPVGLFLCEITKCTPIEKDFKAYSCMAANLELRVDRIIELEQPILKDGKPVEREGKPLMTVQPVPEGNMADVEGLFLGAKIFDDISLFHPKEKEGTKKRRLFVAKRIGIISPTATSISGKDWAGAEGMMVGIKTEWNRWEDKKTKEMRENIKVAWSGYEFAGKFLDDSEVIEEIASVNTDDFSGI